MKWYISTDGVLHLGEGTPILVDTTIFSTESAIPKPVAGTGDVLAKAVSPWYQYQNQDTIKFTKISIDKKITLFDNSSYLFSTLDKVTQISNLSNLKFESVRYTNGMFQSTYALSNMEGTAGWDLSSVSQVSQMFSNTAITKLNVSGWKMTKITNFASMFNSARQLTTIEGINQWVSTSTLQTTYAMFNNATKLNNLDLSNFDTTGVVSMGYMFAGTSALTNLNLGTWETGSVTDMSYMFKGASSLANLDVSKWSTGKVQNMVSMFNGASSLITLDVSSWDTSSVGLNMESDSTKPARYGSMASMFNSASSLTTLDVSNWNTSNVQDMTNMFSGMSKLKVITFGENFNTAKLTSTTKSVALPNTTSTIKWKNIGTGTILMPNGTEFLTAYASKVPDTYVLTPKSIGIDVIVQDSLGNSLSNVEITLYTEDGSAVATVKTNVDGKASFAPQPYGKYSVKQVTDLANYSEPAAEQIELSSTTTDGTNNVTLINIFKPTLPLTGSTDRLWLGVLAGLMIIIGGSAIVIYEKW